MKREHTEESREMISESMTIHHSGQKLPGLAEMRATAEPGMCPLCGDPIPPSSTKKRQICGDDICKRAYNRYWKRDNR